MTFSDPRVAAYVNTHFASAWHNRGPGFSNEDLSTERWIFAQDMEAYPTKNICTFFLSPEGKVFFYVAGFYSPDLFLRFLETAVSLRQELFDSRMQPKAGGLEGARRLHQSRARAMEAAKKHAEESRNKNWRAPLREFRLYGYRGMVHRHSGACLNSLAAGYEYLGLLHRKWIETETLPDLERVRYGYLWGNSFTEETGNARHIVGGDPQSEADLQKKTGGQPAADAEPAPIGSIALPAPLWR